MKKIKSLFMRNYKGDRQVYDEVVLGSEWVIAGEGIATRKFDGSCCMVQEGVLFKRYDVKKRRRVPEGFIPAQEKDEVTGHWPGWVIVTDEPEDKWFREAFDENLPDGTYELCGPKVQGNPEAFNHHVLVPHGGEKLDDVPRTFMTLRDYFVFVKQNIVGIVWHHADGRMVKIKRRDFGFSRIR